LKVYANEVLSVRLFGSHCQSLLRKAMPSPVVLATILSACRASQPPHLVLLIGDDMGRNDVGYSDSTVLTPNFDSMAGSGVKFSACYTWHWCAPSRGSMLSGRLPPNHGFEQGGDGPDKGFVDALPLAFKLLPEILREQGYRTIMAGKWHLGYPTPAHTPEGRGFDEYLGYLTGAEDYYLHTKAPVPDCPNTHDLWRAGSHGGRPENGSKYFPRYSTFIFSDYIVAAIETTMAEQSNKPMFIYASFQGIHSPLEVPKQYFDLYKTQGADEGDCAWSKLRKRGGFDCKQPKGSASGANCLCNRLIVKAQVSCLDEALGNITDAMKRTGMYNNSVIVVQGDNVSRFSVVIDSSRSITFTDLYLSLSTRGIQLQGRPDLRRPFQHSSSWWQAERTNLTHRTFAVCLRDDMPMLTLF
jgi:arylsulfatase A-like enzyme